MTLLADLVATSERVAATRSRSAKVAALADLLRRVEPHEVAPTVALLSGEARQGRIGIGWATLAALDTIPAAVPSLTLADFDRVADRLAATSGPGSVATRTAALAGLFGRATEGEEAFLRRLFTGDLRQGALEAVMLDAVARAAALPASEVRRAAMLAGDLCAVATLALTPAADGGGAAALGAIRLQPLRPVLPMLAASAPDVGAALDATGLASVEWKLDGARIQVHRDGDDVRIFTRNLNDVTSRLPDIAAVARDVPARSFVLDGEALGLDEDAARPERFQDTMSRFGSHAPSTLAARFFDCLHVDGDDLLDRPLVERVAVLDRLAGPWRVPAIVTDDPRAASELFAGVVAAGHEGVMVKSADSPYEAGRRGGAWRKVKPVATFDLVVLASEWGHGRRQGWLSNLHLGARGPDGGYVMVGKTFKGLTDELLEWQTAELLAREVRRSGVVVHVRPELVVEVALDGVQSSTRYPGGLALRFARVRRYRPDKMAAEADTLESLRALL
ncbi:MAG TPA: ATP-dependent DNA ligase [Acidimicrobiales bacterium]|nr:ATP-dependent DNA ligase [Acidimicrobiales bacterium]